MLDGRRKLPFSFANTEETTPSAEPWRDGVDITLVLSKLRERKQFVFKCAFFGAVCAGLCGAGWLVLRPISYSAATEILITNTTLQLTGQDAVVTQLMVENTLLQSQILLTRSNAVMERTIARIGQDQIKDMLPQPGLLGQIGKVFSFGAKPAPGSAEAKLDRNALLQALKANMTVVRIGASQILGLQFRGASPDTAVMLAQEATQAFLWETRDINAVVTTSGAFRERIRVLGPTARVISEALPPISKDGPRGLLVLMLAPLLGGLVGCGVALVMAVTSRRIWSGEQLTARTGGEFFGRIAVSHCQVQKPLHAQESLRGQELLPSSLRPRSSFAGVLRRIRTAAVERRGSRPRVIGITGMERGGKTTVAVGLALLLAGDGQRVLLVDAGLTVPDLTQRLDADSKTGLQQVLRDPEQFTQALHPNLRPCLDMLPSGHGQNDLDTRWPNLLKGMDLKGIDTTGKNTTGKNTIGLTTAGTSYDWVILDLPVMGISADLRAALCVLDDLVIVTERGVTSGPALSSALVSLGTGRHKLMGTLITDPQQRKSWRPTVKSLLKRSPEQAPTAKGVPKDVVKIFAKVMTKAAAASRLSPRRESV